jgi:lantibiotic modifying enzyme
VDDNFLQNLNSQSADAISLGEYDYLLGGTGSLLFAVDVKKRNYVNALLSKLISLSARVENDSPIWYQSPSLNVSQDKVINLGLAHGIPGILTILSSSVSLADNPHDISILISKCFDWLKANQLNPSIDGCYFPFSKSESNEAFPSSLRWCYGDLGVSISLILIGRRIGNQMIEGYGLEIATHCASRNIDKSGISDAHICQGTAGIAHIYNRLFNYTGKRLFKEASVYWVLETLNRFNPQLQSGFQAWKGKFGWVEYDGLLEGSAGIGLTLISAISDIEPKWDRCILLS